jgi:crotonobetainyl-CoA:carnitine CoA-transferase CaiB-like acyl-CoA transferase
MMIAIYHRENTGEGQFVDVSIQDSITRCTPERITAHWDFTKKINHRGQRMGLTNIRRIWPCKDGYVYAIYWSGQYARRWNTPLVKWMESEGVATEFLSNFDWDKFDMMSMDEETVRQVEGPTLALFTKYTKTELLEGALKFNAQLYPISTTKDILENTQLKARDFWVKLEHPELDETITYPGPFAKCTGIPPKLYRRASLIGEHNIEIYADELGLSRDYLINLKQAGVI